MIRYLKEIFEIKKKINKNYILTIYKAIKYNLSEGFKPKELFVFGLLNCDNRNKKFNSKYCSKAAMLKIQQKLNPKPWQCTTNNKDIFNRICNANNIPVPIIYGSSLLDNSILTLEGKFIKSKNDWIKFIKEKLPDKFVMKPAKGCYGRNFYIVKKNGNKSLQLSNRILSFEKFYNFLNKNLHKRQFIFQEVLESHQDIVKLSESKYLQTIRIITFIDNLGQFHVLHAFLKIIAKDNKYDNFDSGKSGNLLSEISLTSGRLVNGITIGLDGSGPKVIKKHPNTGINFNGFKLPLWKEAISIVEGASFKFLPKRTIGWDVALTDRGIFILEGNARYDPPCLTHPNIDEFLSILKTDI